MKDSITREKIFDHDIQFVWKAISEAEQLSAWFIQADFKAEKGYKYRFKATGDGECTPIIGEVLEATPYTLIYTWIVEGTDIETTVSWTLEDLGGKTRLFLEHTGISNYPGESAITFFEDFSGGWTNCINELASHLAKQLNEHVN